jgi:hypothetical protein
VCDELIPDVPLVAGWPRTVRSIVLHVISLAHCAIVTARGWAANSINARVRLTAENDQAKQEVQLLREELRIKDARIARIHAKHRPRSTSFATRARSSGATDSSPGANAEASSLGLALWVTAAASL